MNTLSKSSLIKAFLFSFTLIGIDQLTKYLAVKAIPFFPIYGFKNLFGLTFVTNSGAAWGIFAQHTWLLALLSVAAVIVIPFFIVKQKDDWQRWALILIWVGAFGNGIDRLFRGYVIDFLYLWPWPIFNVADLSIVIGASLLAVLSFFQK